MRTCRRLGKPESALGERAGIAAIWHTFWSAPFDERLMRCAVSVAFPNSGCTHLQVKHTFI